MKKLLGVLLASVGLLAGIMAYEQFVGFDRGTLDEKISPLEASVVVPEITPIVQEKPRTDARAYEENIVEAEDAEWDEEALNEEEEEILSELNGIKTHDAYSYAYNKLNEKERELYDIMYAATIEYKDGVFLPVLDVDVIDKVFNCIMIDHPEIFYVNGYRYTRYTQGDVLKKIAFTASYNYTKSEKESLEPRLEQAIVAITQNVYANATDYEKIKYIYEYIITHTEYDLNSTDNQNIISVLLNGRTVCQGYAKTFQLLLNRIGIECTMATGMVYTGERHAWNVCKADGEWYYVDATWGDASYQASDANQAAFVPDVNYDYLLVTSDEIERTHSFDTPVSMPYTQALANNYYVKEGLYLVSYDTNQLKAIFDYQKNIGANNVSFKCADGIVYNQIRSELLDNQKIFDYIKTGQIRYSEDPMLYKLVFALE